VSGSTGTVWVTDGVLRAGYPSGCFQDSLASVGGQGSGRLSATNSTLLLYNLSVGSAGTLECVDSQFNALNGGCTVVNSNVMLFVNSTGSFSVNLLNAGTVTVDSSTLTFSGAVTNSGTIIATNGVVQFLAGINNSGAVVLGRDQFRVTSAAVSGSDAVISWQVFGGNRYRVQASTNLTTYVDISPEIAASGSGLSETNYIDVGAVTNFPNRNYRVRQVF